MSAPIAIDLPPHALTALRRRARAEQMSPATLAHKLLVEALGTDLLTASALVPAEQALLDRLRTLLEVDLARAETWGDLQTRLAAHGYTFRERGGGLALYCTTTAAQICKASDLGWPYADLIRKLGAPFPGHSQKGLARRVLHRAEAEGHPDLFPDLLEDEGEIILVEDD